MLFRESSRGGENTFHSNSIKIILPPKPRYEGDNYDISNNNNNDNYDNNGNGNGNGNSNSNINNKINHGGESRMDVCALTLSCLAQDPNLPSSKLPFAWKLFEMLETVHKNEIDTDIVSWVDNGNAFKVHDLQRFVDKIVPTYFKQSKYKSFQRQLYFYGFTRESTSGKKGHTPGSYRHPMFVRRKKALCLSMAPQKAKKRGSNKSPDLGSSTAVTNNITQVPAVVRKVSGEVDNSLPSTDHNNNDDMAPIPLHDQSPITATIQTANDIIRDRGSSNDMTNLECSSSTATIRTANGIDPQSQFIQQQNHLQRLQTQGFLRSIQQDDRKPEPAAPSAPSLHFSVSDGRMCNIFGGNFHVVGRKKSR